uniref:CCHC-type domain-containing protein n=1 Tax=Zonotrichia albicollis TaxID=44394 RepID=A0A8D2MXB3_ZONAL
EPFAEHSPFVGCRREDSCSRPSPKAEPQQQQPLGCRRALCCACRTPSSVLTPVSPCAPPQSKLHMEGFRSLKEGEAVEFTFKKSSKGLESIRVTGPGGVFCIGSERRPKGKSLQKRRSKGDRCYNCGGLDHHAKECKLPPQPKKCHFCQSISHMVANCPAKAQQSPSSQGKPAYFREEEDMHSPALLPESRE